MGRPRSAGNHVHAVDAGELCEGRADALETVRASSGVRPRQATPRRASEPEEAVRMTRLFRQFDLEWRSDLRGGRQRRAVLLLRTIARLLVTGYRPALSKRAISVRLPSCAARSASIRRRKPGSFFAQRDPGGLSGEVESRSTSRSAPGYPAHQPRLLDVKSGP